VDALDALADWPVDSAAGASVGPDGQHRTFGDIDQIFELASVTKLMTALAVLVAHEEGSIDLDAPATPAGATAADLLAHAAGIGPDQPDQISAPLTRRIYSTAGYELVAQVVTDSTGIAFPTYAREAVFAPLGMGMTALEGSAGAGARSSVRDLLRLCEAWRTPTLIHEATLTRATTPHLPALGGVLPGFGRQIPNLWGLGPEIRGEKSPHWTAAGNAPSTFGHFGQTGTMVWIDPVADITLIVLTNRAFGPWATEAWPLLSAAVLAS
jgi:CubicO group peptidase (beta-lactamase class C family)